MLYVPPHRRTEVLGALLPSTPEPGSQGGFHLLEQDRVGDAWVSEDRSSGLMTTQHGAWVYGEPNPKVGSFLKKLGFRGPVHGAVSSVDPRRAIEGYAQEDERTYVVFVSDEAPDSPPPPSEIATRAPMPQDTQDIERSKGRWVLALWPTPHEARYSVVGLDPKDQLIGVGGARSISPRYAEIAVWIAPEWRQHTLALTHAGQVFPPIIEAGLAVTAMAREQNEPAIAAARAVGWDVVGTCHAVLTGSVRAARDAERLGTLQRARERSLGE